MDVFGERRMGCGVYNVLHGALDARYTPGSIQDALKTESAESEERATFIAQSDQVLLSGVIEADSSTLVCMRSVRR